jgi:molecular chaperone HscC
MVKRLATIAPNQTKIVLKIYQGESRRVENNLYLGEFEVGGIPRGPAGQEVDVRFTYDLNGILEAEAVVVETGKAFSHVITRYARGLTAKQVSQAVAALQALKVHPREEAQNRFLIHRAERLLAELPFDIRRTFEQVLDGFEEALELRDANAIERFRERLQKYFAQFDSGEVPRDEFDDDFPSGAG